MKHITGLSATAAFVRCWQIYESGGSIKTTFVRLFAGLLNAVPCRHLFVHGDFSAGAGEFDRVRACGVVGMVVLALGSSLAGQTKNEDRGARQGGSLPAMAWVRRLVEFPSFSSKNGLAPYFR